MIKKLLLLSLLFIPIRLFAGGSAMTFDVAPMVNGVSSTADQSISGNKTFTGPVTISSCSIDNLYVSSITGRSPITFVSPIIAKSSLDITGGVISDTVTVTGVFSGSGASLTNIPPKGLTANSSTVALTTNWSTSSWETWVTRTGSTVSITIQKTSVMLYLSSTWYLGGSSSTNPFGQLRINVDSGAAYYDVGTISFINSPMSTSVGYRSFIGGSFYITGLTPGTHTFSIEGNVNHPTDTLGNYAATDYNFHDFFRMTVVEQ